MGIVGLVVLLALAGGVYYAYVKVRDKVRTVSTVLFGTEELVEGMQKRELEVANTPKSVAAATKLYLPRIMEDFPEFHYDEMKTRAENVLTSYLRCVDAQSNSGLTEGTNELRDQLLMRIQMAKRQNIVERFREIRIHRTEIHQYRKAKGRCSIVFQSAVEYKHYAEQDGKLIEGRRDLQEQAKYNVEVMYIQDQELIAESGEDGLARNCPNCGAPLPGLGAMKCEYCDTPVIEFNIRTWAFSKVEQQDRKVVGKAYS